MPGHEDRILDISTYYEEDYINALAASTREAVVVVTSWSSGALTFPRSVNIGSRQARHLPHHLIYAQKLKRKGVRLKIYYLAFDNIQHFNQKDKRCVDNYISKSYRNYILSFDGTPLDDDQFEGIYLNPHYREKDGDLVEEGLPVISNRKGETLHFTGENAILLRELRGKLMRHRASGHFILGLTAHSGGDELEAFCGYLNLGIIGASRASVKYGTKEGNKKLFARADVPYVKGSTKAHKNLDDLIEDCYKIACETKCKVLIIKHNASSAGKGNLDVDISACYQGADKTVNRTLIHRTVLGAIEKHTHPVKDKDILPGVENFYARKIRELGAIVEEKIEGKKIVSPASFGVVKQTGAVVVEYIYDQVLLGDKGQNFGGSIGPSELSERDVAYMDYLTRKVGAKFAELGGRGYFGVDFLKVDERPIFIIEANIRTTGTKYPYIMTRHLLAETPLSTRATFHDDNIKLPLAVSDLTGRRHELNLFMDSFFVWIRTQDVSFSMSTKMGALITFESHTNGKIGVLSIGRDREHVKDIRKRFVDLFQHFATVVYTRSILPSHPAGANPAYIVPHVARRLSLDDLKSAVPRGLVSGPLFEQKSRSVLQRFIDSTESKLEHTCVGFDRMVSKAGLASRRSLSLAPTGARTPSLSMEHDIARRCREAAGEGREHPFVPYSEVLAERSRIRPLVFVILGRTRTSDQVLIQAASVGITCYRMTENSEFTFNENERIGFVKKVSYPKVNPRTGKLKMYSDETTPFDLPTVVYDYDFSGSRKLTYHSRGDRTFLDKITTVREFLEKIGAVFFNRDSAIESTVSRLSPTRSQWAFSNLLQTFDPELFSLYPVTIPLVTDSGGHPQTMRFISSFSQFYIKPVLSERRPESQVGNIFVRKVLEAHESIVVFQYCVSERTDDRTTLVSKSYQVCLDSLRITEFIGVVNMIKTEMGFASDVQFLLQAFTDTPLIRDQSGRVILSKIRVVTQQDPAERTIVPTSVYGVYGGHNAYLGYVGDPSLLIQAYLRSWHTVHLGSEAAIYNKMIDVALRAHRAIEAEIKGRMGELVTDILLTPHGVIPLKTNSKPERPDMDDVGAQTHFGQPLEPSKELHEAFIERLKASEKKRFELIIAEARRLHIEVFHSAESLRKSRVDRFIPVVMGAPLPTGVAVPTFKSSPFCAASLCP